VTGHNERLTKLKAQGTVNGSLAVSARLVLERFNLQEADPSQSEVDQFITARARELFGLLHRP
jgi:hypothetical protein